MDGVHIIRSIEHGRDLVMMDCGEPANLPSHPGWTFVENTGILQMNTDTFVASQDTLQKLPIHGGIFASCPSFASSQALATAATHVAKNWEALAIYHNRDTLSDLLDLFPSVKEMLLPHNLNLLPAAAGRMKVSRLRELCGSCVGVSNCMVLGRRTSLEMVLRCPQLQAAACDLRGFQIRLDKPSLVSSVVLGIHGSHVVTGDLVVYSDASPAYVAATAMISPRLTSLRLTTKSSAAISNIDLFTSLTSLDIAYSGEKRCPFAPTVSGVLQRHPLSSISLRYFDGVQLSSMVPNSGKLTELVFKDCTIVEEDVQPHSLATLQTCYLSAPITPKMMASILAACSSNLVELGLGGDDVCSLFLRSAFDKATCISLEMLTLKTDTKVAEEDLKDLLRCCTHLKAVKTDCADVRQFLEANAAQVCLLWSNCRTCIDEFGKVNDAKGQFWEKLGLVT